MPPESGNDSNSLPSAESVEPVLPPVEPPSGRFLIQLFVVPAVIVMFVVGVWWLVTSLATRGAQDPTKVVAKLRASNQNRWQEAYELANMLQVEKRYPKLKSNRELATELAALLAEEIAAEATDENSVKLRMFLCSALGAFKVDEGLDELLQAASADVDTGVQRAAVDAIAVRAQTLAAAEPPTALYHPQLVETFVSLANQPDELIRSQTAYALGVLTQVDTADLQLTAELEKLVEDLHSDTRYNAALALARRGNLRAIGAVSEMFDREAIELSVKGEEATGRQIHKRNTILRNAIEAARSLAAQNPNADLSKLREALATFVEEAPQWESFDRSLEGLVELAEKLLSDSYQS